MRTSKSILLMAAILCLSLLWPLSSGYCSETTGQPQTQTIEQSSALSRLQINNEKQKQKLQLLEKELIQLSSQLQLSQTATAEARQSLTESQKQVSELTIILYQQKQQINQLHQHLNGLSSSAENAENSIQATNQSLQQARQEMLAAQKAHETTEKRLRTQKTLWQILAIGLGAWGATK